MTKKVALFWPGDYRPKPNEWALPHIRPGDRADEQRAPQAGPPTLPRRGLSDPAARVDREAGADRRSDDRRLRPLVLRPAHDRRRRSARTTRCCSRAISPGTWPGLVGLLNTGACLEIGRPPFSRIWTDAPDWSATSTLHGAPRRVVLDRAASSTHEASCTITRRSAPRPPRRAAPVAEDIRSRRVLDLDARRHLDGDDQRLLRPAPPQKHRLHRAQDRSGVDHRPRPAHRRRSASTTPSRFVQDKGVTFHWDETGRRDFDEARRRSSSATTWRCSTWSASSRPTAWAGSTSSASSRCAARAISPRGCSTRPAAPSRTATRSPARPRPTRATWSRWS